MNYQVLKKDQKYPTVEGSKVKEESLEVSGCSKNIWLRWLQVTGEQIILFSLKSYIGNFQR